MASARIAVALLVLWPATTWARPEQDSTDRQRSLAARAAIKIPVRAPGWYRVGQPQLLAAGLKKGVDPRTFQLFAEGVEVPIRVLGEADGRFDARDAVEFYGTGLDTPFTDTRMYWLIAGDQTGRRIGVVGGYHGGRSDARSFPFPIERRERTIYFAALRNGGGNKFFGAIVASGASADESLTLTNLDSTASNTAELEVALQGVTDRPDVTPDHRVGVLVNGSEVGEVVFDGQALGVQSFPFSQSLLTSGANTVTLAARGGEIDVSLVEHIRLTYWHTYTADSDSLRFSAAGQQPVTIRGFSTADIRVIDLTDPVSPVELLGTVRTQSDGHAIVVQPSGSGPRSLLAFTGSTISSPGPLRLNQPSHWTDPAKGADYVIVSHADFLNSLEPLRILRESHGHSVAIVDIEDLYDELSFGEKTPRALKDFVIRAHAAWRTPPRFLLLVGNATTDPRNYLGLGQVDYVPTASVPTAALETASDDWFADADGDGRPELAAVGRLPVRSVVQADAMVAKIRAYESAGEGGWTKDILFVADQNDKENDFEQATAALEPLLPLAYQRHDIFRGRVGTGAARTELLGRMNQGQLIVNYFGHASVDLWRDNLLTGDDAPGLSNGARLPLVLAMTCLNGFFQGLYPEESLAEALLRAPDGGAIAVWASSTLTSPSGQIEMDRELFRLLFSGAYPTLGEAVAAAKKATGDIDVRRSWILFGDPAMRLKGLPQHSLSDNLVPPPIVNRRLRLEPVPEPARGERQTSKRKSDDRPVKDAVERGWQILSADLNGDGLSDLLLYDHDTGAWREALSFGDGTSEYHEGSWLPDCVVRTVDLNGDGRADVFLYQRQSGAWLEAFSDGRGAFTYRHGTWPPGKDVEFGDFNGDGTVDMLFYDRITGSGLVGSNDRTGGFPAIQGPSSPGWTVHVGDFNGDHRADLLLYDPTTGAWVEALGDGAGRFTHHRGVWWAGGELHVGDFDGDGRADVFLYNPTTGSWMMAMATMPGEFAYQQGVWAPGWIVTAGDLNGDGRADVFLYDLATGQSVRCLTIQPGRFEYTPVVWPRGSSLTGEPR